MCMTECKTAAAVQGLVSFQVCHVVCRMDVYTAVQEQKRSSLQSHVVTMSWVFVTVA